ncbi:MAG TPA: asparagine synthase (glutamine-hydrolyzing) [Alphaproteobacteria bacterium]|nr:asparagine synthase (glutamine-hydrolyzing) [Alphaproteobacteria bacterium]
MCGIAGVIFTDPAKYVDEALLSRMCTSLRHRGPDDQGLFLSRSVGLGVRRLSVIDLASGHQPIANETGAVVVSLNGEIYNFRELRTSLTAKGHRFRTQTDTEVIVHLYEEDGVDAVQRLRGMFALALWDGERQRLLLARDRLGKKPLYYAQRPDRLLFASEIKAILQDPTVPTTVDPHAVDAYLAFQFVPHPLTIYQAIRKLPPAHRLIWERGNITIEPYWRLDFSRKAALADDELAEALRAQLAEATQLRLISDVPLGALLSGGVDSSIVVALMAQLLDRPVQTFSIGFSEETYNELPYARQVAQQFGTWHSERIVTPDIRGILPRLVWQYDEPFADKSAIPTFYVAQMARDHVTVVLNGDGGDEAFAGYDKYRLGRLQRAWSYLPTSLRQTLAQRLLAPLLNGDGLVRSRWRTRLVRSLLPYADALFYPEFFEPSRRFALYQSWMRAALADRPAPMAALVEEGLADLNDPIDLMQWLDYQWYLPGDLLVKMDIASMACSLEARSPFLDHRVVEFCAALPASVKTDGHRRKIALREAFRNVLPAPILERPKQGFSIPLRAWLRGPLAPLARELLVEHPRGLREFFDLGVIQRLYASQMSGRRNHAHRLWALMLFELWYRLMIEQHAYRMAPPSLPDYESMPLYSDVSADHRRR